MDGVFCKWFLVFALLMAYIGCGNANSDTEVREAAYAGSWYPGTAAQLGKTVDGYLAKAENTPVSGRVAALIVPHAGYIYSGQVAAYAYKQIQGMEFDVVVLVGPSHNYRFSGVSVYKSGIYRNPLGDVVVDSKTAERLISQNAAIEFQPQAHIREHSLENQIPFLQRTLSGPKIVTVLMQDFSKQNCDMLSTSLANVLEGKNVLLIASTDMSHYPVYDEAVKADKVTLAAIETMDTDLIRKRLGEYLRSGVRELHCMLCGRGPVLVVMNTAKKLGADSVRILKYANSGDTPGGDMNRVVGYMAAMLYDSEGSENNESLDAPLNEEQQETLLKLARESIDTYLKTKKKEQPEIQGKRLKVKQGAFVTLRKQGMLRGCIGYILPIKPLQDTIAEMAVSAATQDHRFPPVSLDELKEIDIEISVLSVPRLVQNVDEIVMGTHGVIVRRGGRQGVFLPQVATETGWDREIFLEHLCAGKAGLPKNAWKDKDTELLIFTAQLFEEN